MSLIAPSVWLPRIVTLLLVALIAVTVSFWVLRWRQQTAKLPAPRPLANAVQVDSQAVARVLGSIGPAAPIYAPSNATRFVLTGVLAAPSGRGVALIAVDGKPGRAYQVGAQVDGSTVLRSVGARLATLSVTGQDRDELTLELPALKRTVTAPADVKTLLGHATQTQNAPSTSGFGVAPNLPNLPKQPAAVEFQNRTGADQY